ncbi:DUF2946 family protein [Pacificimonas flava]|nr:DUF2946 family protein [Pacificimonas flava]MBB5281095.1 hypothetical protein [Pacificimonas flava]
MSTEVQGSVRRNVAPDRLAREGYDAAVMTARRHLRTARNRTMYAALFGLAMLMRIMIPQGFMPVQSDDGFLLTICTGQGVIQTRVSAEKYGIGADSEQHEGRQGSSPCDYAATITGHALPEAFSELLPHLWMPVAFRAAGVIADLVLPRMAAPPPPERGPPAQS